MVLAGNGVILEIEPWNKIISDTRRYQKQGVIMKTFLP